jgi:hypothetical protein
MINKTLIPVLGYSIIRFKQGKNRYPNALKAPSEIG